MRFSKLLTWLDVRRTVREKTNYGTHLPDGVARIGCFSDALEIGIIDDRSMESAKGTLRKWFGDWYQEDQSVIQLDIGDTVLPVEFFPGEERTEGDILIRPFWEEIVYAVRGHDGEASGPENIRLPEPFPSDAPHLIAFYSFKGGVGRTLHLSAYLFALLERAGELGLAKTILVIDADLEAPGLTYWDRLEKQQSPVSFIDFLEVCHYSSSDMEKKLSLFAGEVKKSPKTYRKSTWYVLPACLDDRELLDMPVLPEHLARNNYDPWEYGNAVSRLGKAVGADYVLLDLRAGLSEISAPIIFDPRVRHFIITTIADQSVRGTNLVLEHISKVAPSGSVEEAENEKYYDPSLIISMLKPEFKSLPEFETALTGFRSSYAETGDDNLLPRRLPVLETHFNEELLYVNGWEDARLKLGPTRVMKVAREWADSHLTQEPFPELGTHKAPKTIQDVQELTKVCQLHEYAENGEGEHLLITEPLKSLAITFQNQLPHVVSIGAKGAGKTFNYIQLSRFKYWEDFRNYVSESSDRTDLKTYVFPFLQSRKLGDKAKEIVNRARGEVKAALGESLADFSPSKIQDSILRSLKHTGRTEPEWAGFWIEEMAKALNIELKKDQLTDFSAINQELKRRSLRIIFLFDGLEDIFSETGYDPVQQTAIRSLIYLPDRLSELRESYLGMIIFLRRDFLRHTITQNLPQFENLYKSFDLSWNADSFLKLVFWVCSQAGVIGLKDENVYHLTREEMISLLEQLWGKKLGSDRSKEAYTRKWVFAALTDFKGRLQARDIVRFLYHAGNITLADSKTVQFEKWRTSRLLPPQAIRKALIPCSEKKVRDIRDEYPEFDKWIEDMSSADYDDKRNIPFSLRDLGIDPSTTGKMLEEIGVIYEDKTKNGITCFYMPEIFRVGLGFGLDKSARPRVLVLKRKAVGSDPF